ncbi:Solute carrier family 22 member 22 [Hondaea fermentalgiana]|uniref:Solute carrier family 22 member 22 n=1 Tax=Hondaea fermentalgiana TaxID=2315210 RepID=A0A2R5G3Z8_9STRA|nr:Solute carrier family 22 member 22 [Hondaea fermentalgiana]|eukprot:GBG25757.1 Solute carrier family 22 member 22 [Hondaea fermentalgiana]
MELTRTNGAPRDGPRASQRDELDELDDEHRVFDMDEAMTIIGFGPFQYQGIAVAGLLLSVDAMEMMLLSFLGPSVRCEFGISKEEEALLTTVVFIGAMLGAYVCGVLADRFGRRYCLKWLSTLTFILGFASAFAPDFSSLVVIRGVMGICLGGSSVGFSYLLELLPTKSRGRWGILIELFWTLGTMLEAGLAWIIFDTQQSPGAWRTLLIASSVPVLIAALCFLCNAVPQSPRFLATNGQVDAAYQVLCRAARRNGKTLPANGSLRDSHGSDSGHGGMGNPLQVFKILRVLFSRTFRVLTLFLWFIWFTNAFSYYGLVLMTTSLAVEHDTTTNSDEVELYCDPVTQSPFETSNAFVSVFVATAAELPGVLFAAYVVDTLGRKSSQSICFGGTCIALVAMFALPISSTTDTICLFFGRALIEAAFVLTYVYTPEVYPTTIRTTAFGLANAFSRVGGMVAPFIGQDLVERGDREMAIMIFAVFTGFAVLAAILLPVETKGVALADTPEDVDTRMGKIDPIMEDEDEQARRVRVESDYEREQDLTIT